MKNKIGQKTADFITLAVGSWWFIVIFIIIMAIWVILNTITLIGIVPWDKYPYVLLNLILSTISALQAPIIMMSQNRQSELDRQRAEFDHELNKQINKKLDIILKTGIIQIAELNDIDDKLETLTSE